MKTWILHIILTYKMWFKNHNNKLLILMLEWILGFYV